MAVDGRRSSLALTDGKIVNVDSLDQDLGGIIHKKSREFGFKHPNGPLLIKENFMVLSKKGFFIEGHGTNTNACNSVNKGIQFLSRPNSVGTNLVDMVSDGMPIKKLAGVDENPWKRKPYIMLDFKEDDMVFSEDGKSMKLIEEMEVSNSHKLRNSLVIKVFGKEVPTHVVAWEIRRQWKLFGNFHFTTLGKGWFLCSFESNEMMDGVLLGGPWFVNGYIVGMEKWSLQFSTLSLKGLTSPIWIRMPHLPLHCWDEVNVARIASSIGKPLTMDGVWVESIYGKLFQRFGYEKVSTLCYGCGMVGHLKDDCKIKVVGNSGRGMNEGELREAKEMEKVHE
ncbi:uncharacterized protein LOC114580364 [Dendrobium catenatum]|uniref:uncharacterized protein LOC114580364 n=1 Tax=Dendrobium catenatum TaxID=906689 RepID=UPI00109F0899|nr:uncharacterized protein LOC114580364 [Dendrobium catenatum]